MKNEIYDVTFMNAFVLHFKVSTDTVPHFNGESISGLKYNNKRVIWEKDTIFCKNKGWYQVNSINLVEKYEKYHLYAANVMERSDTSMMILPFNGSTRKELRWGEYLVNAFSFREGFDDNDRIWVLLRRPLNNNNEYQNVVNVLRECEEFVDEEYIGTEFHMFTLLIPEDFRDDVDLILRSRFSRISEQAKRRILAFHNIFDDDNKLKLQLYRHQVLRDHMEKNLQVRISPDAELRDPIKTDRETFFNDYIIEDYRYVLEITEQ